MLANDRTTRQRLFRALHRACPTTRRALALAAAGHSLERIGELLGCHPRLLERRLETLAQGLKAEAQPSISR